MINHTACDHPSTSAARAKCRRAIKSGSKSRPASVQTIDFSKGGSGPKASTPRDRDMQCDNCGVERISMRGTDPISGLILTVGDKCSYMLKQATDIKPLD